MGLTCYTDPPRKPTLVNPEKNNIEDIAKNHSTLSSNKKSQNQIKNKTKKGQEDENNKIERKKEKSLSTRIKNNIKDIIKDKDNQKKIKRNNSQPKIKDETKPYINLNKNKNNYYVICPQCNTVPFIRKVNYDKKRNDFNVSFNCQCTEKDGNETENSKTTYLINLIHPFDNDSFKKYFANEEIARQMSDLVKQNSENFKGTELLKHLIQQNQFNLSVAPLPSNFSKSNLSTNITKSNVKESDIHIEVSNNFDKEFEIPFEKNKSKYISRMPIIQEEEQEEKYKCTKTMKDNSIISSLIQLKSGLIATGNYDSKICIWDIKKGLCTRKLEDDNTVFCLLEFDDNYLLSGTTNNTISFWNLDSSKNEYEYNFKGHEKYVNCLVKCDDKFFASCSNDKTIRIWNFYEKKLMRTINAHNDSILCLIKLKDGNLCSGGADLLIKMWNWYNGLCIFEAYAHNNWVKCLCQLKDGTLISGSDDKTIKIWNNKTDYSMLCDHTEAVKSLCQIDDNYFVSCSFDKTLKIWNLKNLNCCQTLLGHERTVLQVIKLDNNNLVSCSSDNTIKLWEHI